MSDTASKLLEHQIVMLNKLTEAISLDASNWGYTDPRDLGIGDTPPFIPPIPNSGQAFLNRLKRGEYLPAFLTEPQLAWMRRRIRLTVINNEIAINAVNQRVNYSVGCGLKYQVQKKHDSIPDELITAAQHYVDMFIETNNLAQREAELVARMDIDGEALLRVFPRAGGCLHVRFVEPEHCFSPAGDLGGSSFGVETDKYDVEDVKGYWIINGMPDEGAKPEFTEASDILHVKHPETPLNSKRGLSSFFSIEPTLRAAEDLLTSTVFLAKSRAKIAWIQKLSGTTATLAQQLANNQASYNATDPATGDNLNIERYRYGSILRIPSTSEIEMPSANLAASDHVAVMQMVLRIIAARYSMPEYMLTADASNGSYSSTLVAESPFVKSMERLQSHVGKHLGGNRFGTNTKALIWRQLSHCADCGLLPKGIERLIDVQVVSPTLTVRDVAKEAQVDKIYYEMGVKSLTTIALQQDLDIEVEAKNRKKEEEMGLGKKPEPPAIPPPIPPGSTDPNAPALRTESFNPDQPRADDGKFGSGGGTASPPSPDNPPGSTERKEKLTKASDAADSLNTAASDWSGLTPSEGDWDALEDHTSKAEGIAKQAEELAALAPKAGKKLAKHAERVKKLTSAYRDRIAKAKDAAAYAASIKPPESPALVERQPEPVKVEIPDETQEMKLMKDWMSTLSEESDEYKAMDADYDKKAEHQEAEQAKAEKEYDLAHEKWLKSDDKADREDAKAEAAHERAVDKYDAAVEKAESAWEKADDTNTALGETLDELASAFADASLELHNEASSLEDEDTTDDED